MTLVTSLVVFFYCCATADILTNFYSNASCFSLLWLYLGNSQVSVYRTIGPTLVILSCYFVEFLAHLSRRLIGELIVYPWSGVCVRPSSASSTMLKHLLLRNRLADQSQILCGASLGRGNDILFAASGSHDQDGRYAHIW